MSDQCLAFDLAFPDIPDIFVNPPLVPPLPFPLEIDIFCCKFTIPDILGLNAIIAGLNAALKALGGEANAILAAAQAEILALLAPLLQLALHLRLECPFD